MILLVKIVNNFKIVVIEISIIILASLNSNKIKVMKIKKSSLLKTHKIYNKIIMMQKITINRLIRTLINQKFPFHQQIIKIKIKITVIPTFQISVYKTFKMKINLTKFKLKRG